MKRLIIANWKCSPVSLKESKTLFNSVKKGLKSLKKTEVVICPPFVYLPVLSAIIRSSFIKLGAQNCFWELAGAFTGEISPLMLKNLGCQYVIIGHSERRHYLLETDEMINKKLKKLLEMGLKPIFCLGETADERKKGKTFVVLKKQLTKALNRLPTQLFNRLIIAYEPVWAIGTGHPCQPVEARKILLFLQKKLKQVPVLYGGSVNSSNALEYLQVGFNGLLVGGASLKADEFVKMVKQIDFF